MRNRRFAGQGGGPLPGSPIALNPALVDNARRAAGYLGPYLVKAAASKRFVIPMQSADILIASGPVRLAHPSFEAVLAACKVAVQGAATKVQAAMITPAAGTDISLALGAGKYFGARIRIATPPFYNSAGLIRATITFTGGTAYTVNIYPKKSRHNGENVTEFIALAVSDNAGTGSIVSATNLTLGLVNANPSTNGIVPAQTFVSVEGLNERDLTTGGEL